MFLGSAVQICEKKGHIIPAKIGNLGYISSDKFWAQIWLHKQWQSGHKQPKGEMCENQITKVT